MDFSSINWLAVVACVVVSMIVGSVWFGRNAFFPIWWAALGKTESPDMSGSGSMFTTFGLTILAAFVEAVFMALMVNVMGSTTLLAGAATGFMLWLGFVATTSVTNRVFAGQLKAWVFEAGNHLINFILFGAILGVWH